MQSWRERWRGWWLVDGFGLAGLLACVAFLAFSPRESPRWTIWPNLFLAGGESPFWALLPNVAAGLVVLWVGVRVVDAYMVRVRSEEEERRWKSVRTHVAVRVLDHASDFLRAFSTFTEQSTTYYHFEGVYTWAPLDLCAVDPSRFAFEVETKLQHSIEDDWEYGRPSGRTDEERVSFEQRELEPYRREARRLRGGLSRLVRDLGPWLRPDLLERILLLELNLQAVDETKRSNPHLLLDCGGLGVCVLEALAMSAGLIQEFDAVRQTEEEREQELERFIKDASRRTEETLSRLSNLREQIARGVSP